MISAQVVADAVKWELWSFFSTEAHSTNAIIRYINSACRDICILKNFTFNKYTLNITVTSGITEYDIPYQIETFWVIDWSWKRLDVKNFEDYNLSESKDDIIWIWDEKMVCTTPWTYTILYRWFIPTIYSLNSSIAIPEHFYDAVVAQAIYYWYLDEKDYSTAWARKYMFDGLIASLATRNTNTLPLTDVRVWSAHSF